MTERWKAAFLAEISKGKELFEMNDLAGAYRHFERAHILGQKSIIMHTRAHYWFLRIGIRQNNFSEILGQLVRIPLGILGSLFGVVPEGNTGGANVSLFKPMPIPDDLKLILNRGAES